VQDPPLRDAPGGGAGMREALIWTSTILATLIVVLVWHFAVTTEWKKRGLYVWRTRKPHALLGLPVIGRHNAYVGMTSSRYHRDLQHIHGGSKGTPPAPWSDLSPRVYALPCLLPGWEFARRVQEKFWILLLLPVYNQQFNKHNPRRLTRSYAYTLKQRRQAGGRRFNASLALLRAPVPVSLLFLLWYWGPSWIN
jgi:hypothetical protein